MSRYCLRGRWYSLKPNSKLQYDSESDPEEAKDAKKVVQLTAIIPKQSIVIEKGSTSENLSQSKVEEPKIRKTLNL